MEAPDGDGGEAGLVITPRLCIAVGMAILVGVLSGSAHAANSQTFQDSLGENPSGPDITSIVVSNDDAGLITWKINISNRPALTQDMTILIYLDTDQNASTGDKSSEGAEYAIDRKSVV